MIGEKRQRLKNFLVPMAICLMFVFIGLGMIFIAENDENPMKSYIGGIIVITFFGSLGIYYLFKFITDKDFFKEKPTAWQKHLESHPKLIKLAIPHKQDIEILKILKKNNYLALPYILTVVGIIYFLIYEFKNKMILDYVRHFDLGLVEIFIYLYLLSFILIPIWSLF